MDWNELVINWSGEAPVYQQLANYFGGLISSGELKEGDALPTETALCKTLGISRSTVRQAFLQLEDDGVIVRKKRVGTRVCKPKLKRNINNLYNFTTEMQALGLVPSSRILSFQRFTRRLRLPKRCILTPARRPFALSGSALRTESL
jgi:GntR family transcriptional regulator